MICCSYQLWNQNIVFLNEPSLSIIICQLQILIHERLTLFILLLSKLFLYIYILENCALLCQCLLDIWCTWLLFTQTSVKPKKSLWKMGQYNGVNWDILLTADCTIVNFIASIDSSCPCITILQDAGCVFFKASSQSSSSF